MKRFASIIALPLLCLLATPVRAQVPRGTPVKVKGFYTLVHESAKQDGASMALDIAGTADGTVVQATRKPDTSGQLLEAQRFYFRPWKGNRVVIAARTDGWQVLSSNAGWANDPVRAWAWMTSPDQFWVVEDAGDNFVRIRHNEKGLALALDSSQKLVLTPNGDRWRLVGDVTGCQTIQQWDQLMHRGDGNRNTHPDVTWVYATGPGRGLNLGKARTYPLDAGFFRLQKPRDQKLLGSKLESCQLQNYFIHVNPQGAVTLDWDDGSAAFEQASVFKVNNPIVKSHSPPLTTFETTTGQYLRSCSPSQRDTARLLLGSWDTPGCPGYEDRWSFARTSAFRLFQMSDWPPTI